MRDREAAVPLAVSMPVSVTLGLGVGKGVAGFILPSPPIISGVEGIANDVTGRELVVLVLGSVLLVVELSASMPVLLPCTALIDPSMCFSGVAVCVLVVSFNAATFFVQRKKEKMKCQR